MTNGRILPRIRTMTSVVLLTLMSGANPALADDTEIFFGAGSVSSTIRPNILFILDTSGSMNSTDGTGITRLERMKTAVRQIIDSSTNINIGMMRFNGSDGGGPILFPVTYIDEELCPNGICSNGEDSGGVSLSFRVANSSDDATEDSGSLQVETTEPVINFFHSDSTTSISVTDTYRVDSSSNFAEQAADGGSGWTSGWSNSWDFDSFYDGFKIVWGLRFENVVVPDDATISNAFVRFHGSTTWNNNQGLVAADIFGEDTDDAHSFRDSSGRRVLDRTLTSNSANWKIPFIINANGAAADTPDLSSIFTEITDRPGFTSGSDEIALIFKNDDSTSTADLLHHRHLYTPINSPSDRPVLHLTYNSEVSATKTVGLRFDDVKIPQGANVTQAILEFTSSQSHSSTTTSTIYAHDTDNSPTFSTTNGNITSRSKTQASEAWTIPSWGSSGEIVQSDDISDVVQEVVDRNNWCGGNALSLILEGSGLREAISYDTNPDEAPVLKISYDASSIPSGGGCTTARSLSSIAVGTDDAVEQSGGQVIRTEDKLDVPMTSGLENIIGLRFTDVKVPKNASITSAYLSLTAESDGSDSTSWRILGEQSADAAQFSYSSHDLSSRSKTATGVDWTSVDSVSTDETLKSPNIESILSSITSQSGWASGNALALYITRQSGTGGRTVKTYENQPLKAANLVVQYEVAPGTIPPDIQDQISYFTTRQKLHQVLDDMNTSGSTPIVKALYEGGAYYKGMPVRYGLERGFNRDKHEYHRVSYPSSYSGGTVVRSISCSDSNPNSSLCRSEIITGSPSYISPMSSSCQKNHMILLTDGQPNQSGSIDPVKAMIGTTSCVSQSGGTCGEELANYLKNTDNSTAISKIQDITTHTVGFNFTSDWLNNVASAGGGGYYTAESATELTAAFNQILASALKVDTSFVSPATTVNQFNRLTHNNRLYLSLFRPDEKPYWVGNLKQYRLAGDPTRLVDVNGNDAVDEATGFFKETAKSFWSDAVDGALVSKGGAADELELSDRNVYTYTGGDSLLSHSSNLLNESNSSITKQMLNITGQSNAYMANILKWARGVDLNDEDQDGNTNDIRKHFGDPIHSRPLSVDYGSNSAVIYMATNEGFLHAIDSEDGHEVFSFIPQELLPNLDKFYRNDAADDHPYGLDGHLTSWKNTASNKTYLFIGMRRGGNKYYALDITNKNQPKLKWVIDADTNPDFSQLGQTWSKPTMAKIKVGGNKRNVLVFAGGYDTNQDTVTVTTEDSIGNAIFMVDPLDGSLVWSAGSLSSSATEKFSDMKYSIPSTTSLVDINFDGLIDQMYVGDMGGQVWRFDIDNYASGVGDLVSGGVVANLSGTDNQSARRFYYAPDIAVLSENGASFLSIAIGSGWRAHPLNERIQDRFYMIRDHAVFAPPEGYGKDNGNGTFSVITESDLQDVTDNQSPDMSVGSGWKIHMERAGEKVLAKSVTINNQIIFTTYRTGAPPDACTPALGSGTTYVVKATNGSATNNLNNQGSEHDLTKSDRIVELAHGGIPPEAIVLFPSDTNNGNGKEPIIVIGTQKIDIGLGNLTTKTFWQNNPEGSD